MIDDLARMVSPRDEDHGRSRGPDSAASLELGYDGIVVWDGGGDGIDYVVAIVDGSVKVVID